MSTLCLTSVEISKEGDQLSRLSSTWESVLETTIVDCRWILTIVDVWYCSLKSIVDGLASDLSIFKDIQVERQDGGVNNDYSSKKRAGSAYELHIERRIKSCSVRDEREERYKTMPIVNKYSLDLQFLLINVPHHHIGIQLY